MLFNCKIQANIFLGRKCESISVQYNKKKQASSAPQGHDNTISSDWLVLECFTDWEDTKTGLTPAGKLPFHLYIEVLGLEREQISIWRMKKMQGLIKWKIRQEVG